MLGALRCREEYLQETLESLAGLPGLRDVMVVVSQDGVHKGVQALVDRAAEQHFRPPAVRDFEHWQHRRIASLGPSQVCLLSPLSGFGHPAWTPGGTRPCEPNEQPCHPATIWLHLGTPWEMCVIWQCQGGLHVCAPGRESNESREWVMHLTWQEHGTCKCTAAKRQAPDAHESNIWVYWVCSRGMRG